MFFFIYFVSGLFVKGVIERGWDKMADVAILHQTDIPSSKLPYLPEETPSLHTKKPTQSSLRNVSRSTTSSTKTTAWNKNTNSSATGTGVSTGSGNDKNQGPTSGGASSNIGDKKTAGIKQQVESGIDIPQMDQVMGGHWYM